MYGEKWNQIFAQINLRKTPKDIILLDDAGGILSDIFIRGIRNSFAVDVELMNESSLTKAEDILSDSVFVIYRNFEPNLLRIRGYSLKEDFSLDGSDFVESVWSRDFKAYVGFLHFSRTN